MMLTPGDPKALALFQVLFPSCLIKSERKYHAAIINILKTLEYMGTFVKLKGLCHVAQLSSGILRLAWAKMTLEYGTMLMELL